MKIDKLLKHLENIKIDEDEINNINEKREIAEYLAQTFGDDKVLRPIENFMMKDRRVYSYNTYVGLLRSYEISPDDTYVYVNSHNSGTETYSVVYQFSCSHSSCILMYCFKITNFSNSKTLHSLPLP